MTLTRRFCMLLGITVVASTSTILIGRGLYFYTDHYLDFTKTQNLRLALGCGLAFAPAAIFSHHFCRWTVEKKVLLWTIVGYSLCALAMAVFPSSMAVVVVAALLASMFTGTFWPVLESYIHAGLAPGQTIRAVGWFSLAWASAMPLAMLLTGFLLEHSQPALLLSAAVLGLALLPMAALLPPRPTHLPDDHPHRPSPGQMAHLRALLHGGRWSLISSYAMLSILAPLMPEIFKSDLGLDTRQATALTSIHGAMRFCTFVFMHLYGGWHGKARWTLVSALGLPVGFLVVLSGVDLIVVVVGLVIFGITEGIIYYAALYYAMLVRNAAVDAGGVHEGLIGIGFTIGPAMALLGSHLLMGVVPMILICTAGVCWSLRKARPPIDGAEATESSLAEEAP